MRGLERGTVIVIEFLASWGLDIVLGLVSAGITAFFVAKSREWKAQKQKFEEMLREKKNEETEHLMETKLEPIYEELEALRTYIRETESIEKTHMSLIIASYRFRLIQLCKEFIRQGHLTAA